LIRHEKRTVRRFVLAVVLGAMASVVSSDVSAQAWLEDRSRREGPGIRVGNLELHPGLGAEAGYDSNVYLSSAGQTQPSFILRFTPHLDLSTLGAERRAGSEGETREQRERKLAFRLGAAAPIYLFLADSLRHRSNVGAQGSFNLTVRPDGDISFAIYDDYSRSVRPFTEDGANSYGMHRNNFGMTLKAGTDGSVYVTKVTYEFGLNMLEDNAFSYLNNIENRARFGMFWKFFPKTAIFFDSQVIHQSYIGGYPPAARYSYMVRVASNTRVSSSVGLNGAISAKTTVQAQVGYGAALVHDDLMDDLETVIGKLYLSLRPRATLVMRIGYDRDIYPAYSGVYYTLDRGLVELETMLKGRILLGARVWGGYLSSGTVLSAFSSSSGGTVTATPINPEGLTKRTDVIVNGSIFGEYRIKDWLAITASAALIWDQTGFRYNRYFLGPAPPDPANFVKMEAWLGCRVFY
jgi:hypothetical protein